MFGNVCLVLLDCNIDMSTVKLPENYKWHDSEFVKGMSIPEEYDENIEQITKNELHKYWTRMNGSRIC